MDERTRLLLLLGVIEEAGILKEAQEDVLNRAEAHFGADDIALWEARDFVRQMPPHCYPRAAAPAAHEAGNTTKSSRRKERVILTAEQLKKLDGLPPGSAEKLTRAREEVAKQRTTGA